MSRTGTNLRWVIGPCVVLDVSTPSAPRKTAIFDRADEGILRPDLGRWRARHHHGGFYTIRKGSPNMHIMLLPAVPDGCVRDHRNGDGLDNRRCNLRVATHSQNAFNRGRRSGGTSRFKGVYRDKWGVWIAQIRLDGKARVIGRFRDEAEAAAAYDALARPAHGAFARLNLDASA